MDNADRHQIVVHVDAMTLAKERDGRCEFEHGPTLSVKTPRLLSCDASVIAVVENDKGESLSDGRKTRLIPPALRRALKTRDEGCRFPGCTYHWSCQDENDPAGLSHCALLNMRRYAGRSAANSNTAPRPAEV